MVRNARRQSLRFMLILQRRLTGLRYVLRVIIGLTIVWFVIGRLMHAEPLWGAISTVVVTDVKVESAYTAFISRLLNTLIGCAIGVLFLKLFGFSAVAILSAVAVSIVISTDFVRVPISWRIAPITALIVMFPGHYTHTQSAAIEAAIARTLEVLFGSAVALAITAITGGVLRTPESLRKAISDKMQSPAS